MEHDVNRIEFVIQTREHIFQICIDCIVHNDILFKSYFFIMFGRVLGNVLSAPLLRVC